MDLQKAYDKIPRKHLFEVLLHELNIDASILKYLMRMYIEIKAFVYING